MRWTRYRSRSSRHGAVRKRVRALDSSRMMVSIMKFLYAIYKYVKQFANKAQSHMLLCREASFRRRQLHLVRPDKAPQRFVLAGIFRREHRAVHDDVYSRREESHRRQALREILQTVASFKT